MKLNILAMALISLVGFAGTAHAETEKKADVKNEKTQAEEKEIPTLFPPKEADRSLATRPAQATLVEPKALATFSADNVTLKWNQVPTADHYVVQVATDPNFKWPVAVNWNVKETSFEVKGLQKDQWYFWRVAGVKSDNNPGYTQAFYTSSSFEVK